MQTNKNQICKQTKCQLPNIEWLPRFRECFPGSNQGTALAHVFWKSCCANVLYFVRHINISPETGWDWEMIGLGISKSQTGESLIQNHLNKGAGIYIVHWSFQYFFSFSIFVLLVQSFFGLSPPQSFSMNYIL